MEAILELLTNLGNAIGAAFEGLRHHVSSSIWSGVGEIQRTLAGMGGWLSHQVAQIHDALAGFPTAVYNAVAWIGGKLSELGSWLWSGLQGFANAVITGIQTLGGWIASGLEWLATRFWALVESIASAIGGGISNLITSAVNWFRGLGSAIWDSITAFANMVAGGLGNLVAGIRETVGTLITEITKALETWFSPITLFFQFISEEFAELGVLQPEEIVTQSISRAKALFSEIYGR